MTIPAKIRTIKVRNDQGATNTIIETQPMISLDTFEGKDAIPGRKELHMDGRPVNFISAVEFVDMNGVHWYAT